MVAWLIGAAKKLLVKNQRAKRAEHPVARRSYGTVPASRRPRARKILVGRRGGHVAESRSQ